MAAEIIVGSNVTLNEATYVMELGPEENPRDGPKIIGEIVAPKGTSCEVIAKNKESIKVKCTINGKTYESNILNTSDVASTGGARKNRRSSRKQNRRSRNTRRNRNNRRSNRN